MRENSEITNEDAVVGEFQNSIINYGKAQETFKSYVKQCKSIHSIDNDIMDLVVKNMDAKTQDVIDVLRKEL